MKNIPIHMLIILTSCISFTGCKTVPTKSNAVQQEKINSSSADQALKFCSYAAEEVCALPENDANGAAAYNACRNAGDTLFDLGKICIDTADKQTEAFIKSTPEAASKRKELINKGYALCMQRGKQRYIPEVLSQCLEAKSYWSQSKSNNSSNIALSLINYNLAGAYAMKDGQTSLSQCVYLEQTYSSIIPIKFPFENKSVFKARMEWIKYIDQPMIKPCRNKWKSSDYKKQQQILKMSGDTSF